MRKQTHSIKLNPPLKYEEKCESVLWCTNFNPKLTDYNGN